MRQLYLFAALSLHLTAFAQFTLEHTYTGESGIVRIRLENSGEKYYGVNDATHQIMLYNADHTFWKSIPITPTNAEFTYVRHLSESKIDPDADIEVAYYSGYYVGSTPTYIAKVVREDGSEILNVPGAKSIELSQLEGLPDKIITKKTDGTSQVFDLLGNLEHNYAEGTVSRTKLENSGEKYFVIDSPANALKVLNSDHSLWKTVALAKPAIANYIYVRLVSETQVNTDPLLEVSYTYSQMLNGSTYYESKLVNENGSLLMTAPFCSEIFFSHFDGYPDKVMTRDVHPLSVVSASVYSLPSLNLEHVYPTLTYRAIMENAGERYYTIIPDNGQCKVYHGDHTLYKSINLPVPASITNLAIDQVSQNRVNNDDLVEVSYGYNQSIAGIFYYERKLINELGTVLLTVPDCLNLSMLGAPNLPDKPIGLMYIENSGYFGSVYGQNLSVENFSENQQFLYPNPANQKLHINSGSKIIAVEIYNLTGSLVKKLEGISILDVCTADFPAGLYLLTLTDSNNKKSNHKIMISH